MSSGTPTAGWPARTPRHRWVWWGCGTRPRRWMAPCAMPVQDARFQQLQKQLAISSGAPEPVRQARVPRVVTIPQQGLTRCQKGRSDRQSCVWG